MRRLPLLAIVLGIGGLIPFLACTIGVLLFPDDVPAPRLVQALIDYGAVILSFLGAVHWGLVLAGTRPDTAPVMPRDEKLRLALGVLPALVGWAALLIPLVASPLLGVLVLTLGFVLTTLTEARAGHRGLMPPGYMGLRWVLSGVVVVCLVAVLLDRVA